MSKKLERFPSFGIEALEKMKCLELLKMTRKELRRQYSD